MSYSTCLTLGYFSWLEKEILDGKKVSEVQASDKLEGFRAVLDGFRGLSFETISGMGANGAIIQYEYASSY